MTRIAEATLARIDAVLDGQIIEPTFAPNEGDSSSKTYELPAGEPDLAALTLAADDLPPGFEVEEERYDDPDGSLANYVRTLRADAPVASGSSRVRFLLVSPILGTDRAGADEVHAFFETFLTDSAPETIDTIASLLLLEDSDDFEFDFDLVSARPIAVDGVGERALGLVVAKLENGPDQLEALMILFQLDRVVTAVVARGPTLVVEDIAGLAQQQAGKLALGLESNAEA